MTVITSILGRAAVGVVAGAMVLGFASPAMAADHAGAVTLTAAGTASTTAHNPDDWGRHCGHWDGHRPCNHGHWGHHPGAWERHRPLWTPGYYEPAPADPTPAGSYTCNGGPGVLYCPAPADSAPESAPADPAPAGSYTCNGGPGVLYCPAP
jgi:hypothetical protein